MKLPTNFYKNLKLESLKICVAHQPQVIAGTALQKSPIFHHF